MQSITIRFPEIKCVICESVLPPGQEAFVHPTVKGPKGGKKYLHPGCASGARSNPRRSSIRHAEGKALLGFKSSREKKIEAAERHRRKSLQSMRKAQRMADKLEQRKIPGSSPQWYGVEDLAREAYTESLNAIHLYGELGPEFAHRVEKGEEFAFRADNFQSSVGDYTLGLAYSPYVPDSNLRFNPRRGNEESMNVKRASAALARRRANPVLWAHTSSEEDLRNIIKMYEAMTSTSLARQAVLEEVEQGLASPGPSGWVSRRAQRLQAEAKVIGLSHAAVADARTELAERPRRETRQGRAGARFAAIRDSGPIGVPRRVHFAKGVVSAVVPAETVLVTGGSDSELIALDADLAPIAGWRVAHDGPEAWTEEMTPLELARWRVNREVLLREARRPGQRSSAERFFGVAGHNPRRGKGKRLPPPTVPHPGPADWVLKTTKELVALVRRGGPKAAGAGEELARRGRDVSGEKQ